MPKKDINLTAKSIVDIATGLAPKAAPKDKLAAKSGALGGKARAAGMSAKKRSAAAKKAAAARWGK